MTFADNPLWMQHAREQKRSDPSELTTFFVNYCGSQEREGRVSVSSDDLGNLMLTSSKITESTPIGTEPFRMIISPQGAELIRQNENLAHILTSEPIYPRPNFGHSESDIYMLSLNFPVTDDQNRTQIRERGFVEKRIHETEEFPERYFLGSGIIAMRLMQKASREQPSNRMRYAVPLIATHRLTIAPLIYDSGTTLAVVNALIPKHGDSLKKALERLHSRMVPDLDVVKGMLQKEWACLKSSEYDFQVPFGEIVTKSLRKAGPAIDQWLAKQAEEDPIIKAYHSDDQFDFEVLVQSIINVRKLAKLALEYREKPPPINRAFVNRVLEMTTIVEFGSKGELSQ